MKKFLTLLGALVVFISNTQTLLAGCMCPPVDVHHTALHQTALHHTALHHTAQAESKPALPCHADPIPLTPAFSPCCADYSGAAPAPRTDDTDLPSPVWQPFAMLPEPAKPVVAPAVDSATLAAPPPLTPPFYLVECCFLK